MPIISMFYGIIISMYYSDHMPPHFHAKYQDFEGMFYLDGEMFKGDIPSKQQKYIQVWADIHHAELLEAWQDASQNKNLTSIRGLK